MSERKEQGKSVCRQRRWQVSFAVVVLFLVYTLSGFFLLPWVLKTQAEKYLPTLLLRSVMVSQIRFNPFTLKLKIDGFKLTGTAGKKTFLKIDSLMLDIAGFLSLTNRALVLEQLDIKEPYFAAVKKRDLSYDFSDILQALTSPSTTVEDEKQPEERSAFRFSLNNITIAGGLVEFDDKSTNTVHKVTDIAINLPWISDFPQLIENHVEPSLSAVVNGTPFSAKGTSKPFNQSLETHFAINLDKLDLPHYLSYLPGKRNFNLAAGFLTTRLDLTYVHLKDGKQRLNLRGTVKVNDFLVRGKDKEKDYRFISFPELLITLGSGNLLAGEIFIDEIVCRKPEIDFLHKQDGAYYLPMLIAAASSEEPVPPAAAGTEKVNLTDDKPESKIVFKLLKMSLEEGIFKVHDKRVTPSFSTRFSPVDLTIENISTVAGASAQYSLKLKSDLGEALSCTGDFSLYPLKVNTHFALQNLPLPKYVAYYKDYFAGRFSGSQLGLSGDVAVAKTEAGEIRMNLRSFTCELDDCKLSTPDGKPFLKMPHFEIAQGEIDFDEHECVIGSVSAGQGIVNLTRRKDGALSFSDLLPPKVVPEKSNSGKAPELNLAEVSSATQAAEKSWHLLLTKGSLQDFAVNFKDLVPATATLIQIDKINLGLDKFGTGKNEAGSFKLSLRLARKGTLIIDGAVGLDPLQAKLNVNLKKLPLPIFQNYLDGYLDLALLSGDFTTKGQLFLKGDPAGENRLDYSGNMFLDNLKTVAADQSGGLLNWRHLELDNFVYHSQPPTILLKRVLSEGLKVNLVKGSAGRTNFEKIVSEKRVSPTATADGRKTSVPKKNRTLQLNVQEVKLVDNAFDFKDHSLSPSVEMSLDNFAGSIAGISSAGKNPAAVDLAGRLNKQAAISVSGAINPFPEDLMVDLQIKGDGVGLTSVSPYSGKYVGYAVSKGKVSFDLNYQVKDNKLVAKNDIFIDQFDFGETVDSPDAMSLPVKMAVSLLRNRQGEIDLNLPVSGDLNDPEFSIAGIIVKVFINLITKAVTSPFALIGSLAGGGADLNHVGFVPGQAGLDAGAQERLLKLGKVLYDRPGLKVEIDGRAVTPADRETMQNEHFMKLLKLQKLKDEDGKKPVRDIVDVVIEKDEFKDYLWQAYKTAPMEKEKVLLGLVKKIDPVEQERRLREFVKVSDNELLSLAKKRSQTVMDFLIEKGPLEPKRLFLVAPQIIAAGTDSNPGNQVEIKIK